MTLTKQYLQDILEYDALTGVFTWKSRRPNKQAGTISRKGYRRITIDHVQHYAHRLAWIITHGSLDPSLSIDHIDGDKQNNAIDNLRLATPSQQLMNQAQVRGIKLEKRTNRWTAGLTIKGDYIHLGTFDCPLLARLSYEDARQQHFGSFA